MTMQRAAWLKAALDYLPRWLEFQMRLHQQPGCAVAIVHRGRIVLEAAFGHADAVKRTPLTPRHLFRVASHSKSFTAAGIMKLREQKRSCGSGTRWGATSAGCIRRSRAQRSPSSFRTARAWCATGPTPASLSTGARF